MSSWSGAETLAPSVKPSSLMLAHRPSPDGLDLKRKRVGEEVDPGWREHGRVVAADIVDGETTINEWAPAVSRLVGQPRSINVGPEERNRSPQSGRHVSAGCNECSPRHSCEVRVGGQ